MIEKRRTPRTNVSLEAKLIVEGDVIAGQLRNLSLGGACVFSRHSFSSATDVKVKLETPSQTLTLLGRTVYSFQFEPGIFRTGIRFHALNEDNRAIVQALISDVKAV